MSSQLQVTFTGAEDAGGFTAYTVRVEGQEGSTWTVAKRYTSFLEFSELLGERYPSAKLPTLPGKAWFGNTDPAFIAKRQTALEAYMRGVAAMPSIGRSEPVLLFLSTTDVATTLPADAVAATPADVVKDAPREGESGADAGAGAGAGAGAATGADAAEKAVEEEAEVAAVDETEATPATDEAAEADA